MWIADVFDNEYGKTEFNIYDQSLFPQEESGVTVEHVHHNGLLEHDPLKSAEMEHFHLRFQTKEDAIEFSEILKVKYFDERDKLLKRIFEIDKSLQINLESDRLKFDRSKKMKNIIKNDRA